MTKRAKQGKFKAGDRIRVLSGWTGVVLRANYSQIMPHLTVKWDQNGVTGRIGVTSSGVTKITLD